MVRLTYAPDLVEDAVLLAESAVGTADWRAFRHERNRLYEVQGDDRRERHFQELHLRWFARLGLHLLVERGIAERPELTGRVGEGRVVRALGRQEERGDVIDRVIPGSAGVRPLLVLRLQPATLREPERLHALLRHELTHVSDMLDPAFGYQRTLPPSDDAPSADHLLRDRYRVLWNVTIDGRLARAGLAGDRVKAVRRREFAATFRMLDDRLDEIFDQWFDRVHPTHAALVAFARAPFEAGHASPGGSARCPLCRFPVASLDHRAERLPAEAVAAIRRDYPTWTLAQGLCAQCLDLFEARMAATR